MTRLSRIHPYPGMIADELAIQLSEEYVKPGDRILDPFCGTGRTLLAAAQRGAAAVGVDTNPLATLLVMAKASVASVKVLRRLLEDMADGPIIESGGQIYNFEGGRKVRWFSIRAARELSALIAFLNRQTLRSQELYILATVLSATAREVSYCRNDQWKIHRISPAKRSAFKKSAWRVFLNRLRYVINELAESEPLPASCRALLGDSRNLSALLCENGEKNPFDLIFSSPPYGDSRTTVQYGGVSTLCLGVVRHLNRLKLQLRHDWSIDRSCLGGDLTSASSVDQLTAKTLRRFWAGNNTNSAVKRIQAFLLDLSACCHQMIENLKLGGAAIFVVARRTVGGAQLKLDRFLVSIMESLGCVLDWVERREISGKRTPFLVSIRGNSKRSLADDSDYVPTMRYEYVLLFRKVRVR